MFCDNLVRSGGNGSRKTENMRASEYESRRSSEDLELKDMKELESNDEAFHLSWREISAITDAIRLRITPTPETYKQWNEYEASFYLKICTCFGFNPQHLEPEDENVKKKQHLTPIKFPVKDEVLSEKDSYIMCEDPDAFNQLRKDLQEFDELEWIGVEPTRSGPLVTGFYVCEPRWIPYHLYLLVKKVAETITRKDLNELDIVEEKIKFFCTYFISHLPCGWKYERDNVNSLIAKYETMSGPKFSMNGFTPLVDNLDDEKFDERTDLTEKEMADVMTVIHSRKMPDFTKMGWQKITFHCKLCSCFGIKYTLEGASDDDVYLMDFGRNG